MLRSTSYTSRGKILESLNEGLGSLMCAGPPPGMQPSVAGHRRVKRDKGDEQSDQPEHEASCGEQLVEKEASRKFMISCT
jgi:hypothetical protein